MNTVRNNRGIQDDHDGFHCLTFSFRMI
jgi:hypothetical protein